MLNKLLNSLGRALIGVTMIPAFAVLVTACVIALVLVPLFFILLLPAACLLWAAGELK